ncbi:MAG: stage II sporulation protein M [Armatimonadetes bacterium]|nr:stage II sporulation protein M [Armatimonadota bacterium]
MITIDEFIRQRKADWELLTSMTRQVQRQGFASLQPKELEQYSRLYRRATGDLARVQTRYRDAELALYLNQLVGQAHGQIYIAPAFGPRQVLRFFLYGFPRLVRENLRPIMLSFLISMAAATLAFVATWINPEANASAFLPGIILDQVREGLRHSGEDRGARQSMYPLAEVFASFIMTNNIKVGFIAFATGVLWGVPTCLILVQNGGMLGALSAIALKYGAGLPFWSLILPHGIIELSAIFICGGAGLILGQAMIAPGDYLRKDALSRAAKKAVRLIVGCIPLFVIAALIESYVTPAPLDEFLKIGFALLTGVGLLAYLNVREPAR